MSIAKRKMGFGKKYIGVQVSDELITEQSGIRSVKEMVEQMLTAGQSLTEFRNAELENFQPTDYDDLQHETYEEIKRYEGDMVEEEQNIKRRMRFYEEKKVQSNTENEEQLEQRKEEIPISRQSEEVKISQEKQVEA